MERHGGHRSQLIIWAVGEARSRRRADTAGKPAIALQPRAPSDASLVDQGESAIVVDWALPSN
jgi:hypothetical protein